MAVINPPNTPLVDTSARITPEWYRFLVAIQKNLTDRAVASEDDVISVGGMSAYEDARSGEDALFAPVIFYETFPDILIPPPSEPDPTYRAGPETVATDADFTAVPDPAGKTFRHTGTLTADRAVTLSTTNARAGTQTLFVRTGAGAFNLSIGGLKNLVTNTWALVEHDGSAWFLASYGAL